MALVLVLAVGAQWLGWRLRLPALLFLLVIGFALGQWVTPDEIFGRKLLFDGVNPVSYTHLTLPTIYSV